MGTQEFMGCFGINVGKVGPVTPYEEMDVLQSKLFSVE
jgi:hypothetical protein